MLKERSTSLGTCRTRSGREDPCGQPATVEVNGVPLCGRCAGEHSLYTLMGDLAQAQGLVSDWGREARNLRNEPLAEALELLGLDFSRRFVVAARALKEPREAR